MTTSFKIQHQNELRRLTPSATSAKESWTSLEQKISQLISVPVGEFTVKYTDEDGDLITLSTDSELTDLVNSTASTSKGAASTIRLQVFPKALPTGSVTTIPLATATDSSTHTNTNTNTNAAPVENLSRTEAEDDQSDDNSDSDNDDDYEGEDNEPEEPEEQEAVTTNVSAEEKGKEKIDEAKQQQQQQQQQQPSSEEKKETEEEPQQPSLGDIFERAAKLQEIVQDIFEQHPEIGEEVEAIKELFATFLVNQVKEQQRQQEEARQRQREFFASGLRAFGFPAFGHHQPQQQQPQQQQPQQQQPPRPQHCQPTEGSHCEPRRCGNGHPFARAFGEKLSTLENMGFTDRDLNVFLLRKYRGSIKAIVQALSEEL